MTETTSRGRDSESDSSSCYHCFPDAADGTTRKRKANAPFYHGGNGRVQCHRREAQLEPPVEPCRSLRLNSAGSGREEDEQRGAVQV